MILLLKQLILYRKDVKMKKIIYISAAEQNNSMTFGDDPRVANLVSQIKEEIPKAIEALCNIERNGKSIISQALNRTEAQLESEYSDIKSQFNIEQFVVPSSEYTSLSDYILYSDDKIKKLKNQLKNLNKLLHTSVYSHSGIFDILWLSEYLCPFNDEISYTKDYSSLNWNVYILLALQCKKGMDMTQDYRIYAANGAISANEFVKRTYKATGIDSNIVQDILTTVDTVNRNTGSQLYRACSHDIEELSSEENYRMCKELLDICKSIYNEHEDNSRPSKRTNWSTVKQTLENSTYSDPIYEGEDGGDILEDMIDDAADSLGVTIEPSIQNGQGSQIFYDDNNNELGECDYADFNNDIIDIALNSSSKKGCQSEIKRYIKSLLSA